MGIRKHDHNYKILTPIYKIPIDILKSTTSLKQSTFEYDKRTILIAHISKPNGDTIIKTFRDKDAINNYIARNNNKINSSKNNIDSLQKSESEQIQQYKLIKIRKKVFVQKELVNSDDTIFMTRITKIYDKHTIYNMLYCILFNTYKENPKSDRIYLSHLQIYKHCKNVINSENAVILKVDDSTYVSASRLKLLTEVICYLLSLINHDTLNFDESGDFINDFVEKNIDQICKWENDLRMSLFLDGFFQAIYDLIMERDTDIFIDSELKFGDRISDKLTSADGCKARCDRKKSLLDKLSLSASFFNDYFQKTCTSKNKSYIHNVFEPTIFVNRNYEQKCINNLNATYIKWLEDLKDAKKSHTFNILEELFCFYHINRVTHIIDMKNSKSCTNASLPIHRMKGLFTPIILKQIFEENNDLVNKTPSVSLASKPNELNKIVYCYSSNENRSHRNITERDIVFIKNIIDNISYTFKENIFTKMRNKKSSLDDHKVSKYSMELILDYKKAYKYFEDFSKDTTILEFLDKANFTDIINDLQTNEIQTAYYRQIYNDLYKDTPKDII